MDKLNPSSSGLKSLILSPLIFLRVFAGDPLGLRTAIRTFTLGFAVVAVSAAGALAQNTGGAKGKVRNLKDEGIANATVSARQKGIELKSVKSDSKGGFQIEGLEPGIYNLAFEARGYSAAVQYNVEIKRGKIRDLGDRLILMVDRGSRVIVRGSVFYKDGFIASGAKIMADLVNTDGSTKRLGEVGLDYQGEFSLSQPEGPAKIRLTATLKDGKATKEIDVDSAMVYRTALNLDIDRPEKP